MNWKKESKIFALVAVVFLACFFMPTGWERFGNALLEALHLVRWYAREHVLLCLIPAFLIAGGMAAFVSQGSVMKYLGPTAGKVLAYGVASVSGSVLAVCSCTVLPLFAGIYRMGAGIGPATAFLYAGPAVNVLAIILTARVLGMQIGIARAVGAVLFSVVIGLLMHIIFRKGEAGDERINAAAVPTEPARPLWQNAAFFAAMVAVLVFANWARSGDIRAVFLCCPGGLAVHKVEGHVIDRTESTVKVLGVDGTEYTIRNDVLQRIEAAQPGNVQNTVHRFRWSIVMLSVVALLIILRRWFSPPEIGEWLEGSWGFAKQILPLLLLGVFAAGFLLGRPGREALIPGRYVETLVGQSPDPFLATANVDGAVTEMAVRTLWPLFTNFFAALLGAFMYFATLTEVPILQGLLGSGMGKGPALALLLAGPALSLPNMLVIRSVMGTKKTVVFVCLVVLMATLSGLIYGAIAG